ncbi:hypothetical protein [Streptomyces shenzhenensis]|uniref:Uncharacterized protein n=1 Tax=Streptomyces shenzhenensis TaxID=943815 RepID=A0A3M0I7U3_9ACTN|nr:hypothetical protein [Streptomyces shenzhenensis]RMB85621.1 hypothetical protein CTZ28_12585 [Streptomyces shenzhenensis]
MAYCSEEAARTAGVTGSDAEVAAWIAVARERIDAYTQQCFEPTDLVVVADVGAGGLVILPRRVRIITSVMPVLAADDGPSIPSSAYRVTSSKVFGQVDAVHLAWGGYDDLVVGAESYNGGWLGLWERWGAEQVKVAGSFGYDEPSLLVGQACALLAAHLQAEAAPSDADAEQDPSLQVDDEGNNVAIEDSDDEPSEGVVTASASTGSSQVDALLAGYLNRGHSLIGGV